MGAGAAREPDEPVDYYLDVMRGNGLPCYWTHHGHTAAGMIVDVGTLAPDGQPQSR